MAKHNPENERTKRKYLTFLKEAKRQNEASIDAVAKAFSRFEDYTRFGDFKAFRFQQAVGFKKHLSMQDGKHSGKRLSKATLNSTLRHLKSFFQWLALQPGYKSRINYTDTEYFNLSGKEARIATARRNKAVPTIEQIRRTIDLMSANTDIERRDRALVAFTLLTGARDSAIASMKLKHIDFSSDNVYQDAREVNTKFSKTFTTYFFPVGDDIRQIVYDWVVYLKEGLLFGNDDPLFPKTNVESGNVRRFHVSGLKREHWSGASAIRSIFRKAFGMAELPYFNPHSFRSTLAALGESKCRTPEEFKAWSQNLGHEGVLTTFYSYGEVQQQRQSEILQKMQSPNLQLISSIDEIAKAVAQEIRNFNKFEEK